MIKIILNTISVVFLGILFVISNAAGEVRTKLIEMADGHYVEFPMTEKEIEAAIAEKKLENEKKEAQSVKSIRWIERIEMADGHFVEFPMSDEEIEAAIAEKKFEKAFKSEQSAKPDIQVERIEMADGHYVEFPIQDKIDLSENKVGEKESKNLYLCDSGSINVMLKWFLCP
jgi:hypothetical protein